MRKHSRRVDRFDQLHVVIRAREIIGMVVKGDDRVVLSKWLTPVRAVPSAKRKTSPVGSAGGVS